MKRLEPSSADNSTADEAAYWCVVLNEPTCTPADCEAFLQWVRRSPDRVEAYLRVHLVRGALTSATVQWPDTPAATLIEAVRSPTASAVSLLRPLPRSVPPRGRGQMAGLLAVAATILVLISAWLLWRAPGGDRSYSTALGEQRSVLLEDGSRVTINTSSRIEVAYSRERRLVRLVSGEALFEVARNAARPFDVAVDDLVVRAVGTKFNVSRRDRRTTVSVVEGTVKVLTDERPTGGPRAATPARLISAAERVVVSGDEIGTPQSIANPAVVTAWTQRHLVFDNQPLAEVVAEFNRYNRRQIRIDAPALNEQQITGVFQANDSEPFLAFLAQIPGVQIDSTSGEDHVVTTGDADRGEGPKVEP